MADVRIVSGDYFRAMGIPLVKGRIFEEREGRERAAAAIINETMARQMWPGEDPIGKKFVLSWNPPLVADEVIGVVGDVLHEGLDARMRPMVYLGHPRTPYRALTLTMRAAGDPAALTSAVVGQVREMDPEQPVANIRTMEEVEARSLGQRGVVTLLLGVFAGVALLLAAVGLYGVLAYLVMQRTREIGVRMALGATRAEVLRQVVGGALRLSVIGLVAGLGGAVALTRVMTSLLFRTSPTDAVTFGAVAPALLLVSLAASAVPAWRAACVDPRRGAAIRVAANENSHGTNTERTQNGTESAVPLLMARPHDIEQRAFRFACDIAHLCGRLMTRGPVLRRLAYQLFDAGTSVGSNLEEAVAAESRADFISKCSVARKEARESRFWLRLAAASDREAVEWVAPLVTEAGELVAIIGAIVRNAKASRVLRGRKCNV